MLRIAREVGLDFIQLHGLEDKLEFLGTEFGLIPRYVVPDELDLLEEQSLLLTQCVSLPLLDSEVGVKGSYLIGRLLRSYLQKLYLLVG